MKNTKSNSLEMAPLRRLDLCPPFLAYVLARRDTGSAVKRVTLPELVRLSGLSKRTFIRISAKTDWNSVRLDDIKAFLRACGVNPFQMKKHLRFLANHPVRLPYLSLEQSRTFNARSAKLLNSINSRASRT